MRQQKKQMPYKLFLQCGFVMVFIFILIGCSSADRVSDASSEDASTSESTVESTVEHRTISAEEAKTLMNTSEDYVIVDVRTQDEFDTGYIEGAILMPHTQTKELAPDMLPDKSQIILIYCRSGRRSAYAAEDLISMGYTEIYDFGGIIDWPYETMKSDN